MKKYQYIFFDWDGTAVVSRKAPVDAIISLMKSLLEKGIKLIIISGTTYANIAQGSFEELLPKECLHNLYLGLGRGAFNYGFSETGTLQILQQQIPNKEMLLQLHEVAFDFHRMLFAEYGLPTDIIFSRDNYVKIDILVKHYRNDHLFMDSSEIQVLNTWLASYGYTAGIKGLITDITNIGIKKGLHLKTTADAKHLETGFATKSDNIAFFWGLFKPTHEECCFWGDEYSYLAEGIPGSDSYMIIEQTRRSDFFDVSKTPQLLPAEVHSIGNGIDSFHTFLAEQNQ